MKIEMIKHPGGVLCPASDMELEKLNKFKTNEHYEIDIKLTRNPKFLRKAMLFFKYCFNYWSGNEVHAYCSEKEQFDRFRKDLTILAGFYIQSVRINGTIRVEAESLAFSSMSEERFHECYIALTNAAMKHIFKSADESIYNELMGFF